MSHLDVISKLLHVFALCAVFRASCWSAPCLSRQGHQGSYERLDPASYARSHRGDEHYGKLDVSYLLAAQVSTSANNSFTKVCRSGI